MSGPAAATRPGLGAGRGAGLDQVTRTLALALGVGTVVFAGIVIGVIIGQYTSLSPLWSWGATVAVFAPPLAAAILFRVASARTIRTLLAVAAVGYLTSLVLVVPAIVTPTGTLPPAAGSPWILGVSTIGTCAAAVAWRPAIAWPYVVVAAAGLGVVRVAASSESLALIALQDAAYTLLFNAIFAALAIATVRAGRTLDAAADRAIAETRAAAATEAVVRERARIEAFIHDSVLAALLASARGAPRAAAEAERALSELGRVSEAPSSGPISAQDWVWRLQALTTELAPAARFSHDRTGEPAAIAAEAAEAILEAAAEALRNSIEHAGTASRALHVRIEESGTEVTVLDDGVGFDSTAVGDARLGVAVSILDRMRTVPGGDAAVVSRPGVGTRVVLRWHVE